MANNTISVIDIGPFREDTAAGKRHVAQQVNEACESIGFLSVVGHGVSQDLIDEMCGVSREFFQLPEEEKLRAWSAAPDVLRGYGPFMSETVTYAESEPGELNRRVEATLPDLRESFNINRVDYPDEEYFQRPETKVMFQPNIWPRRPARLRKIWTDYYHEMESLAHTLMHVCAVALDLSEDFFDDKIDKHFSNMYAFHYPPQREEPLPRQLRTGPHTDYGSLSILYSDPPDAPGGIQVQGKDGVWIDVRPVPGSFVINLGDLMALWTNDRWVSTLHRVANPPLEQALTERYSVLFFHQPNYDALISCLDNCWDADHPPKYAPITSGQAVMPIYTKVKKDSDQHGVLQQHGKRLSL